MSGVVSAVIMGIVAIAQFDLPGLVPIPLVGRLVFCRGHGFLGDALRKACLQRAWPDLVLIVGITVVCLRYGYLIGIAVGMLCACIVFVINYARLDTIDRAPRGL